MTEPFICLLNITTDVAKSAAEVTQSANGWEWFGRIADILGVGSVLLSIATFLVAKSTRKAIKEHDDIKQYREEIDKHLKNLESLHVSIVKDNLYNEAVLESLLDEMDAITIQYSSVIKPFSKKVNTLIETITETQNEINSTPDYNKSNITRLLNQVIQHLKKVKKSV